MDEATRDKVSIAIKEFFNTLIRIADEENYDRDSLIKACADMLPLIAEISTFRGYQMGDSDCDPGSNGD